MNAASALDQRVLDQLFLEARTHYRFSDRDVPDDLLRKIYDIARIGPTSGNNCPMRVIFVKSPQGKKRLLPGMRPGNVDKVKSAPVTAIFGYDLAFYEHLPRLAPHTVERMEVFRNDPELTHRASFRNATLGAAYFLILARAHGLNCGPMSGFLHDVVDEEFFAGTTVKSNFLMNIGYGLDDGIKPRLYRFGFDEVCSII